MPSAKVSLLLLLPDLLKVLHALLQADEYRRVGDEYQLYTMLMRFARSVVLHPSAL